MKLGIIGKPQSGKTTVFNAACGMQVAVGDFSQTAHRSVIKVPDSRVEELASIIQPKKVTHAEIEILDAPGFTGKGKDSGGLEISEELKLMEALAAVIDCFSLDNTPAKDIQDLRDEMIIHDQTVVESNLSRKKRNLQLTGDKNLASEVDVLKRCLQSLEQEIPLIEMAVNESESKHLRNYSFLSLKPILIVLNIAEDKLSESSAIYAQFEKLVSTNKRELAVMCGKIEMEMVEFDEDERQTFLSELGISTPAVDLVIQKSYALLGLESFFTTGEREVRAWTIKNGTVAQKAAGVVHSDMERGFIRAEVVQYDDFIQYQTPAALKAAGKSRLEGKDYVVRDGDVILFRFNV